MSKSSVVIACRNTWHSSFLALLPQISNYVGPAFRHLQEAEQDDAVQDAVAHAFVMFLRLMQRGRQHAIFPTVLARFGIGHSREGRSFGTSSNSRDVTSKVAHRRSNFVVNRLERYDSRQQRWLEVVIEDSRTPIADQVAFRIDYPAWLSELPRRKRRVAEALAYGDSTNAVARRFRLSAARISQLRRELHDSWERFHGEPCREFTAVPTGIAGVTAGEMAPLKIIAVASRLESDRATSAAPEKPPVPSKCAARQRAKGLGSLVIEFCIEGAELAR
jgi:hypothetical protein